MDYGDSCWCFFCGAKLILETPVYNCPYCKIEYELDIALGNIDFRKE